MCKPAKIIVRILVILAALLVLVAIGGGIYMTNYALKPSDIVRDMDGIRAKTAKRNPDVIPWIDSLTAAGIIRDTVVSFGSAKLYSYYAAADVPSRKTAVIVHGYTSHPMNMMHIARMFRDSLGYNVWLPELRWHGRSDGKAIQMGWKDRIDVLQWSRIAHEYFDDTLQVVHGISMGGATTMMVSGENTPDYVRGFVEDCGYTSAWDEYVGELDKKFGLPPFPILYGADMVCKFRFGWGFHEASSVKQLAKCTKPMLFIHGDDDDFVPTFMVYENYDAKTQGYRELWIAPGSAHANAYSDHPAEYTAVVRKFLKEHVEQ